MAEVQSLGIGSGLLTSELVDDLVAAERAPIDLRIDAQKTVVEAEISAYGEIRSAANDLSNAIDALALNTTFNTKATTSSSASSLTATAGSTAVPGTYAVNITQLAQSHTLVSKTYTNTTDVVGTGTLSFKFGTTTFSNGDYSSFTQKTGSATKTVTITASDSTLSGVRDAINTANIGVQASLVNDGTGFRLFMMTATGGLDNTMEVTASGTAGILALDYNSTSEAADTAKTAVSTTAITTGIDFTADNRYVQMTYNSKALEINVLGTGASGTGAGTKTNALAAIQDALDTALVAQSYTAGDVIAKLDTSNFLYFETKKSGATESLQITSDGKGANSTGSVTLNAAGYAFSGDPSTVTISVDSGANNVAVTVNTDTTSRAATVTAINTAITATGAGPTGLSGLVVATLNSSNQVVLSSTVKSAASKIRIESNNASATTQFGVTATPGVDTTNGINGFGLNDTAAAVTGADSLTQTVAGQSSNFTVNGLAITKNSNVVADVVNGVTLNLLGTTTSAATLSVTHDTSTINTKITTFVDDFNAFRVLYDTYTGFDADEGENGKGGVLIGDSTLRSVFSQVRSLITSMVPQLSTSRIRSLSDVGITTDQLDGFKLKFDPTVFDKLIKTNADDISTLFTTSGSATDSLIDYSSSTVNTVAGIYNVSVSQLATLGTYQGATVSALGTFPYTIDANNDTFTIDVNGVSAAVTLTQASYTSGLLLAQEIESKINGVSALSTAGHLVSVAFDDPSNSMKITSNKYGSTSEIKFTTLDTNTANTLGFLANGQGDFEGKNVTALAITSGVVTDAFAGGNVVLTAGDAPFKITVDGVTSSTIDLAGTYTTGESLRSALSVAINADTAFDAQAAKTAGGAGTTGLITTGIDFSATKRFMSISTNGGTTSTEVLVDGSYGTTGAANATDALLAINQAINSTALNGVVTASLVSDRVVFSTVATGDATQIQVKQTGRGAQNIGTSTGTAIGTDNGFDFATSNATFDLNIGGGAVSVTVNTNTVTTAVNGATVDTRNNTLEAVKAAINATTLTGKVTAKFDASNKIIFEQTDLKGSGSTLTLSNIGGSAAAQLGLTAVGPILGLDGFGHTSGTNTKGRNEITPTVTYKYDTAALAGSFVVASETKSNISFTIDSDKINGVLTKLGFFVGDGSVKRSVIGLNVKGQVNGIDGIGAGQYLTAGSGNTAALPGFYLGNAIGTLSTSTVNDKFRFNVDGIETNDITLATISNPAATNVATLLQTAINADTKIVAANKKVTVQYDATKNAFGIISGSTGFLSKVTVTNTQGNAATIFGFATGQANGSVGKNAIGTADPSAGIRLRVRGGALGSRGTTSFIRGVADQLENLLDDILANDGLFSNREDALNDELDDIAEEIVELDARMLTVEERLIQSFRVNDAIIATINDTQSFLTIQLELLTLGRRDA